MKIQKFLMLLVCIALLVSNAFTDVFIRDIDGKNVEVVFTFKAPSAQKVNLAGSMNGWTTDATAMTKNADGVWEYVLPANMGDEITYKFVTDGGNWIYDEKSPDFIDDGYGGKNGLVSVASVLAQQLAGSDPAAAAALAASLPAGPKKFQFSTVTETGNVTYIDSKKDTFEAQKNTLETSSLWKFSGDIFGNVPAYFEFTAFKSSHDIWKKDGITAGEGFENFISGILFGPLAYLSTGNPLSLGQIKLGFNSPYVNFETGYGDVKYPNHVSSIWKTISEDVKAGSGYTRFELGSDLQNIGDIAQIRVTLSPNKSIDGCYGMYALADASFDMFDVALQYDFRSAEKTDASKLFNKITQQDIVIGGGVYISDFSIKGQFLTNVYHKTSALYSRTAAEKMAYEFDIGYKDLFERFGITLGYSNRGAVAQLLYLTADNAKDVLGDFGTQKIKANGFYALDIGGNSFLKLILDFNTVLQNKNTAASNIAFSIKPKAEFTFSDMIGFDVFFGAYTKLGYSTKPSKGTASFALNEIGLKYTMTLPFVPVINDIEVYYGLNNWNAEKTFNTILAQVAFIHDVKVEAGFGIRTVKETASQAVKNSNNIFGFSLGGSWKIPSVTLKTPLLYAAFVCNMDPYDPDKRENFYLNDYTIKGDGDAVTKNQASTQFRIVLKWDF